MQHKLLDSMHPDEEDAATFAMCTFPVLSQNSQTTTCPTGEEQLAEISRVNIEKFFQPSECPKCGREHSTFPKFEKLPLSLVSQR